MLLINLFKFLFAIGCVITGWIATKYTYLYAKEEGYELDFSPFFMFSAYGKYRHKAFEPQKEDSYYRKMTRLTNIAFLIYFTAIFVVSCIFQLLGYA